MMISQFISKSSINSKYIALALIAIITLTVFYPVLSSNFISLDDNGLISDLNNPDKNFSLKGLFFPHSIDRYYRPFLVLTFIADSKIWLMEPAGYHLTNYILHTLNAFLVFFIALKLFKSYSKSEHIALVCALLFSIHPLTCESVAWVSGRSDILGTFFCLLAFYFYLSRFRGKTVLVILSILLGLLSKENALAIIPIMLIANLFLSYSKEQGLMHTAKSTIIWLIILCIPLTIYLYLRMNGLSQFDHGIKMAVSNNISTSNSAMESSLLYVPATIAFYIKKLFFPFPLNLAIYKINVVFYSGFFIFIMILAGYFYLKKHYCIIIWLMLIIVAFSPAIFAATSKIAWTPFAERYLYLATAVWALSMGVYIQYILEKAPNNARLTSIVIISIMLNFSITTFLRTAVWQNDLTLWTDTYKKSPEFAKVLYKYGVALGGTEGLAYFRKAVEVAKDKDWKDRSLVALANQAKKDKKYLQAIAYYDQALQIRPLPEYYYEAANIMITIKNSKQKEREKNIIKCIDYYEKAYNKKRDPFALYQIGFLYIELKDYKKAHLYFEDIITKFPSSRFADHAKSRLNQIKKLSHSYKSLIYPKANSLLCHSSLDQRDSQGQYSLCL